MADSQPDSNLFSVRIVSIDHYMAPPIPGYDICYSSFQGGKVNEVPVIRVYGSTPAGQKTCLHIHRALPYLYVPCADIPVQLRQEDDGYMHAISLALEKALKVKGSAGSKRQHVHECSLVRAKKFYGYHSSEELFIKIYLSLVFQGGAVFDKSLQPHESHIPFLLQFLVDYNLYGMGHLHLSKLKFRHPVPDAFFPRKFNYSSKQASADFQADSRGTILLGSPIWISSTIPGDWMWQLSNAFDGPSDQNTLWIKHQSLFELEGDATVDDIVNQRLMMYTSLSQTRSDVKMVQSLVPIWEEEYERTGINEAVMAPDPGKPLPQDVLRTLSLGLEFENVLMEMCGEGQETVSSFGNDVEVLKSVACATDEENLIKLGPANYDYKGPEYLTCLKEGKILSALAPQGLVHQEKISLTPSKGKDTCPELPFGGEIHSSEMVGAPGQKEPLIFGIDIPQATDTEALGLLKWLATSQAAEDLNSDDELLHETILSPLLPETTIDKVLEKANTDYERESQKECQDILDSIEDEVNVDGLEERNSSTVDPSNHPETSSNKKIPQIDGSSDDLYLLPCSGSSGNSSKKEIKSESIRSFQHQVPQDTWTNAASKCNVKKKLWGSLPFSVSEQFNKDIETVSCNISNLCVTEVKDHGATGSLVGNELGKSFDALEREDADAHDIKEATAVTGGSVRDLMRRKRSYRESSECEPPRVKRVNVTGEQKNALSMCEKQLEFDTLQNDECEKCPLKGGMGISTVCKENMESPSPFDTKKEYASVSVGDWKADNCKESKFDATSVEPRELQSDHPNNNDSNLNQGTLTGVPTLYLNDGSCLYMLRPPFSPPSVDSVHKWLLHDDKGASGDMDKASVEHSSLKGSDVRPVLEEMHREADEMISTEPTPDLNGVTAIMHNEGHIAEPNACADCLQDISQISGPDGRSKPTPLSQIGFRDPASAGAGEQLTLLSIEVQAESRGDLRPDPRYDSINVVALAFENDSDHAVEIYVLLYCKSESHQRSLVGIPDCKVFVCSKEIHLFSHFIKILCSFDPDILMGWDIQGGSLGFLAERAAHLGIGLLNDISRTPLESKIAAGDSEISERGITDNMLAEPVVAESLLAKDAIIEDEWGRTHASGLHVGGRIVLNVWRLMRGEVKLNMYTVEAVAETVLRRKIPSIPFRVLTKWFASGPGRARYRCVEYVVGRAKLNLEIMNQLDMINRTSELARVFGIDFFSVLSRGSQYRVESMLLRLAHTQNYLAISPGNHQVASQPAMECLPLVMEPESGFYADPVVVLDFQSLYPSMMIAYNLCFCTCLGKILPSKENTLGVSSFRPDLHVLRDLKDEILIPPNGVMYVPPKVRKGVLPRLLEEILSTRIMIFNARQLALKLIANVTYGYTAAGFSGRMPCAELADSIVQCGRSTLEKAISFVNENEKWKAKVIYGDTDSMFVLLKGRTVKESFQIGHEIASAITAMNPNPVTLKMEKVYHPCFLLTKKRYVGYSYENSEQTEPIFDAKGIETVRRDTCAAVAKVMEQSLRLFFEHQDISEVKAYLQRQWTRILSGRVSLQDFVFAKEVRLGTYSTRSSSSLPPAAIVATKAMRADPRAEPRYAERVPYVVVHGDPGARLVDLVVDPLDLLAIDSPYRLNDLYYINKQIIPALQRVFGLVGVDLNQWFLEMPRPSRESFAKHPFYSSNPRRSRIDFYYLSKHCVLCGELVQASTRICNKCSQNEATAAAAVIGRTSKLEKEMQHLAAICRHCGGGDWIVESGVKCTSLACSVFYERRKVQKELQGLSAVAADKGYYPKCIVEWF
ncbi:DNA polymerase zeta catalytic subunit [Citrus sinensis]|uniref:DNA polymerase zeta catalytic subunit n=1 Tax=Citrus sinensis TaxID=2711 RepID=A0ACB8KKZ6_CITSI|nr:DNA polymerase zeta catalytic subunit [Citrus sinensis]